MDALARTVTFGEPAEDLQRAFLDVLVPDEVDAWILSAIDVVFDDAGIRRVISDATAADGSTWTLMWTRNAGLTMTEVAQ